MRKKKAVRNMRCRNRQPLAIETIRHAMVGDERAIRKVLQYYRPIIVQKALRLGVDETGRRYWYIDPLVSGQMESQLMKAIFTFGKHR